MARISSDPIAKEIQKAFTKEYVKIQKNKKGKKQKANKNREYAIINKVEPINLDEIKIPPIEESGIEEVNIDKKTRGISVKVNRNGKTSFLQYRLPTCDVMCNWYTVNGGTPVFDPTAANNYCLNMQAMNNTVNGMPVPDNIWCNVDTLGSCAGGCCVECRDDNPSILTSYSPNPYNHPPFYNGDLDCDRYVVANDGTDAPTKLCRRSACKTNVCSRTTYSYCKDSWDKPTNMTVPLAMELYCNYDTTVVATDPTYVGGGLCVECPGPNNIEGLDGNMICETLYPNNASKALCVDVLPPAKYWMCGECTDANNRPDRGNPCTNGMGHDTYCDPVICKPRDIRKPICKNGTCVQCRDEHNAFDMLHMSVVNVNCLALHALGLPNLNTCKSNSCVECLDEDNIGAPMMNANCVGIGIEICIMNACAMCNPADNDADGNNTVCTMAFTAMTADGLITYATQPTCVVNMCEQCSMDLHCSHLISDAGMDLGLTDGDWIDPVLCKASLCSRPGFLIMGVANYMCSMSGAANLLAYCNANGRNSGKICDKAFQMGACVTCNVGQECPTGNNNYSSYGKCTYDNNNGMGEPYTRTCSSNWRCMGNDASYSTPLGSCVDSTQMDFADALMVTFPINVGNLIVDYNEIVTACMNGCSMFSYLLGPNTAVAVAGAMLGPTNMVDDIWMNYPPNSLMGGAIPPYHIEYCKAICSCVFKHWFIGNNLPVAARPFGWNIAMANAELSNTYSCLQSMARCPLNMINLSLPNMDSCVDANAADTCLMAYCRIPP